MVKKSPVNRRPAYNGPRYYQEKVLNPVPKEHPTMDASNISMDSTEYTMDNGDP